MDITVTVAKPKSIVVTGRRWFQSSYGNTYHSTDVIVDGSLVHQTDFAYGYGDQYLQTAAAALDELGYTPGRGQSGRGDDSHEPLWQYCKRMQITLHHSCSDVQRKKDL